MNRRLVRRLTATILVACFFGMLAGCNTIEGVGKDIQAGGKAIKNEAKEIKSQM